MSKICPNKYCSNKLTWGSYRFCRVCGTELVEFSIPKCECGEKQSDSPFCPHCGRKNGETI